MQSPEQHQSGSESGEQIQQSETSQEMRDEIWDLSYSENPVEAKDLESKETFKFEVISDQGAEKLFSPGELQEKLEQVSNFVNETLGIGDSTLNQIHTYLFSDRGRYEEFLKNLAPDKPESYARDNAVFYYNHKTGEKYIVNLTPSELSEEDIRKVASHGMDIAVAKSMFNATAKANILSSVAHEMTHLHMFFGGVGNDDEKSKWNQEMICEFIGEKVRINEGNNKLRQDLFQQAQGEKLQTNLEATGQDWSQIYATERFFYPYLEKQYGKSKLQELWMELQNSGQTLPIALKEVYEKDDLEDEFKDVLNNATDRKDIETN